MAGIMEDGSKPTSARMFRGDYGDRVRPRQRIRIGGSLRIDPASGLERELRLDLRRARSSIDARDHFLGQQLFVKGNKSDVRRRPPYLDRPPGDSFHSGWDVRV
jgi:hypothetical protein